MWRIGGWFSSVFDNSSRRLQDFPKYSGTDHQNRIPFCKTKYFYIALKLLALIINLYFRQYTVIKRRGSRGGCGTVSRWFIRPGDWDYQDFLRGVCPAQLLLCLVRVYAGAYTKVLNIC